MHSGADKDVLAGNAVLNSPLGDKPITGREAVVEAIQAVRRLADLTYKEILICMTQIVAGWVS